MKRPLLLVCVLLGTAVSDSNRDKNDAAQKKRIVARNMGLRGEHAFWQVYTRYQADLKKIQVRTRKIAKAFAKNHAVFNDQEAKAILDEYLAIEMAAAKLKNDYAKKFLAVMPPVKVARYYQLENKFSAMFRYELAKTIPLVR